MGVNPQLPLRQQRDSRPRVSQRTNTPDDTMWAIWMIIAVAVGGAVSLTTGAVLTVIYFERRRHRRLMERHTLGRNTSQMHRHHLSITDVDVSALPRPAKSLRHSYQRPRSESIRFYASIPSQDEIRTFPEGTITESVVDGAHCQVEGDHQWLAPSKSGRFKRKKKIAKVSTSIPVAKSSMSAIAEATESRRGSPEPVELPAHTTPRIALENSIPMSVKVVQDSHVSIDSVLGAPEPNGVSQRISHGVVVKSRSISAGSIVCPPNIPLPPIPDTIPYDPQRRASLSRSKSDISLHRRNVSVLSQSSAKPPMNAFCGFRFELTGEDVVRKNSNKSTPKPIQSSFRFPQPETVQNSEETFKTIDASTWNLPKSLRTSRPISPTISTNNSEAGSRSVSMIDYDAIFSAGSSLNNSPTKPYEGPLSRPVSALSVSSTDMFRLSVIGSKVPESPRTMGHKRQNCVRIKNLTPIDSKKRLSSQLGRLAEAEEDVKSILLPSPSRVGPNQNQNQSASASDSSLIVSAETECDGALAVPVVKQHQALSLRVKHPGWTSIKDKNKQPRLLPVPCDPVKQDQTTSPQDPTIDTRQALTEIPPTILEAIQTSGTNTPISPASLTRIFSPDSPQRRRTQIQGPRNAPPPSLRVRNQMRAGSPLRRQSSENERVNKQHLHQHYHHHQRDRDRKTSDVDLRKSIAMLKNITLPETASAPVTAPIKLSEHPQTALLIARTPSSRYADSPTIKIPKNRTRSNTVAGHPGERSHLQSNSTSPQQQRQNRDLLTVQTSAPIPATPGKFSYSPSSISIWEDESIRGDSPEPLPPSRSTQTQQQQASSKWNNNLDTSTTTTFPSENNVPFHFQTQQHQSQQQSGRYSPVKSHRDHFDQLSNYSRNVSTQQYQQQRQHSQEHQQQVQFSQPAQSQQQTQSQTQIQRESLWKLQSNADSITARALAVGASGSGKPRSPKDGKRVGSNSPRSRGTGSVISVPVPVPAGLRIVTQAQGTTSSREERETMRMRSHTVSVAPRSMGQTQNQSPSEGVGLGLKFGERSMAYTVNEIGVGRSR